MDRKRYTRRDKCETLKYLFDYCLTATGTWKGQNTTPPRILADLILQFLMDNRVPSEMSFREYINQEVEKYQNES